MPLFQSGKFPQSYGLAGAGSVSSAGSWALWEIGESEERLMGKLAGAYFPLEELAQIHVQQRRLEWLACRLALQTLLPEGAEVRLEKNEWGRPFLQCGRWHISLSHAYPFAAAVVHPAQAVGLDLEKPRQQLLRIKHKFLSVQEQAWAGNDLEKLCLCWTAKEALYKLKGQPGLSFAQDMLLTPAGNGAGLAAWLKEEPYALYHQWHGGLLMCVATALQ